MAYYQDVLGALFDPHEVNGGTLWTIPCNASLPDLVMYVGTGLVVIPGTSMHGTPISPHSGTGSFEIMGELSVPISVLTTSLSVS